MANKEEKATEKTPAAQLWDKIKDIPLDIFALPNQTVKNHVKREESMEAVFPDSVYITLRAAAVLPALEEALSNAVVNGRVKLGKDERLEISQSAKYTVIKVVPK